ncbi:heavy metal translocating P-type ATPase [uncultured Helicobacter sp.]|uniref:heavy metal translocating P-type ATPase n=1 Tax=uncultured Helicobacter sp. TaxID=175537 RepID=UPI00374ED1BD
MQTFSIKNLDCAACADKLERKLRECSGVREVHISFATNTLQIDCEDISSVRALIHSIEPKVQITQKIQKSSFFTPQLFGLLGLITLFLACVALWHWADMESADSLSYDVLAIKLVWIGIYLVSGRNVIKGAIRGFKNKEFFDENVLMLVASIAAFGLGAWEEAVSIMLFFATGEYLQEVSVRRSKEAISEGANLVPSVAHLLVSSDFGNSSLTQDTRISGKPSTECKTSSESNEGLDSRFKVSDSNSESNPIDSESSGNVESSFNSLDSESTTSKNLCGALPNINSACVSTNRAESKALDSAIFAEQKSNQMCSATAPTISRPLRGVKNALRKCRSAFLAFLTRQGESEALPLIAEKTQRVASVAQQKSGALSFSGLGRAGRGETPFSFAQTQDCVKLENMSENEILRNRESNPQILTSTESGAENPQTHNLDSNKADSKTHTESQADLESNPATQEPQSAKTSQATTTDIDPKDLAEGDIIVLYAGEMLPCDSMLLEENASFNTAAISGESLPVESKKGEEILSGSIALNKAIKLQVLRPFAKSQIAQIADLIASATLQKSPTENFITTFARYYTPIVFAFALALALIPPLMFAQSFEEWVYRALVVLMVSCPCALVVSVPIGYFGGLAAASKRGALIKGSNYLEALSKLSTIAFDKTGTLTKGVFEVIDVCPNEGFSKDEVLANALCAQNLSNHPIAKSIRQAYQNLAHTHAISEYEELSGLGVRAVCDNHEILAGNDKILHTFDIAHNTCYVQGSVVHIVRNRQYLGYILIADVLKDEAPEVLGSLRDLGVDSLILSGDGEYPCKVVAQKLGCEYHHSLLPQDKARIFSEIKAQSSSKVAFVGDGINDAPTLALADVGVAMGSGSDISMQSADVIITNNSLKTLLGTIQIAKKTKTIIYQNIALALGIKGVFIVLGLFGLASIWEAIFGDVGVALLALANAMRCMRA